MCLCAQDVCGFTYVLFPHALYVDVGRGEERVNNSNSAKLQTRPWEACVLSPTNQLQS